MCEALAKAMIETNRLFLRPFQEFDFEDLKSVWGDHETMSFYPEPYSDDRIRKIISKQIENFEEHGCGLFAVLEKYTGAFVGDCGITIQDIDGVHEFEIGYHIKSAVWGMAYAPEAAIAVKEYGFGSLQLKKLCSYMESTHKQSGRVAEKIGMELEKEYLNSNNRNLLTTFYSAINPDAQFSTP